MGFMGRRDQKTGSTEPGSNRRVGVKTNSNGMRFSLRRLGAILLILLAVIPLADARGGRKRGNKNKQQKRVSAKGPRSLGDISTALGTTSSHKGLQKLLQEVQRHPKKQKGNQSARQEANTVMENIQQKINNLPKDNGRRLLSRLDSSPHTKCAE